MEHDWIDDIQRQTYIMHLPEDNPDYGTILYLAKMQRILEQRPNRHYGRSQNFRPTGEGHGGIREVHSLVWNSDEIRLPVLKVALRSSLRGPLRMHRREHMARATGANPDTADPDLIEIAHPRSSEDLSMQRRNKGGESCAREREWKSGAAEARKTGS